MINENTIKGNVYKLCHYSQAIVLAFKENEYSKNEDAKNKSFEVLKDTIELFALEPKKFDDKFYPLIIKGNYQPDTNVAVGLAFNRMLIDSCLMYYENQKLEVGYIFKMKALKKYQKTNDAELDKKLIYAGIGTIKKQIIKKIK